MHFDKKAPDFNEENYMSCIMEEDGMEIISTETVSTDQHLQLQIFNCDNCNYSSSYKGNVVNIIFNYIPLYALKLSIISKVKLLD